MHMNKRSLIKILIAVGAFYVLYLTATIFESDLWGNVLAPIGDFISFAILFRTFLRTGKSDFRRYIWLSLSLASLSWLLADIAWAADDLLLARNPDNSQLILMLYL